MKKKEFESPELTLVGEASEVVMGSFCGGDDLPDQSTPDFEFEQD